MKKIFILLLIGFAFSGCEKDDICDAATPKTPRLIIEFYDFAAPAILKPVTNLGITATGFQPIAFTAVSKIQVPLNTAADAVSFNFILNGAAEPTSDDNTDVLTLNYTRETVYVSRACGYKIVFNLTNSAANSVTPDANNWIKNIIISKPNILNENETHIKIYF